MAAKDVYFSSDARDRMLRGVNTLANPENPPLDVARYNRLHPTFGKPATPGNHLSATDFEPMGNLVIAYAIGGQQNNLCPPDAARIQCLRSHSALQFNTLYLGQIDRLALIHHSLHRQGANMTGKTVIGSKISKALH